tara:strand:- start:4567 stop:6399 length:1833 start_codon:yes stop_codon:yes gene_type:complete
MDNYLIRKNFKIFDKIEHFSEENIAKEKFIDYEDLYTGYDNPKKENSISMKSGEYLNFYTGDQFFFYRFNINFSGIKSFELTGNTSSGEKILIFNSEDNIYYSKGIMCGLNTYPSFSKNHVTKKYVMSAFKAMSYEYITFKVIETCDSNKKATVNGLQFLSYDVKNLEFDSIKLINSKNNLLFYKQLQIWVLINGEIKNIVSGVEESDIEIPETIIDEETNNEYSKKNINDNNLSTSYKSDSNVKTTPYISIKFNTKYKFSDVVAVVLYNGEDEVDKYSSNIYGTGFIFQNGDKTTIYSIIEQGGGIQKKQSGTEIYGSYYILGEKFNHAIKSKFLSESVSTSKIYFETNWLEKINLRKQIYGRFILNFVLSSFSGENAKGYFGGLKKYNLDQKRTIFKCIVKDKIASKNLLNKFEDYYKAKDELNDIIESENIADEGGAENNLEDIKNNIENILSGNLEEESIIEEELEEPVIDEENSVIDDEDSVIDEELEEPIEESPIEEESIKVHHQALDIKPLAEQIINDIKFQFMLTNYITNLFKIKSYKKISSKIFANVMTDAGIKKLEISENNGKYKLLSPNSLSASSIYAIIAYLFIFLLILFLILKFKKK